MSSIESQLTELAVSGAQTLVTAMASDVWTGVRDRVAKLFARGEASRQGRQQERLDAIRAELVPLSGAELEQARQDAMDRLRDRLEDLLEDDPQAASALHEILAEYRGRLNASSGEQALQQQVTVKGHGRAYTVGSGSITVNE